MVRQFLSTLKNENRVLFSDMVYIFNLAFGTKMIVNFCDNYIKNNYDFPFEIKSEEFNNILNLYNKDKKSFFDKNN